MVVGLTMLGLGVSMVSERLTNHLLLLLINKLTLKKFQSRFVLSATSLAATPVKPNVHPPFTRIKMKIYFWNR
jgi:hypothetical protein